MATQNVFAVSQKKKRYSEKQWNAVKPDACRLYLHGDKIDEDTRLQAVMGEIERKYGLQACPRTWKSKLKDWGYTKNVPTKTMEWIVAKEMWLGQKGQSTKFFYKQKQVMPRTIGAFKRRRDELEGGLILLDMGTPSDIQYSPKSLITENDSYSQDVELSTNCGHDHTSSCISEATEKALSYKINLPSFPVTKDADGWLSDDQGQLYRYHLFEDVSGHEDALMNHHKALFIEISELENSLVQNFPPDDQLKQRLLAKERLRHSFDLCGIDDHLCINPEPSVNIDQGDSTPEDDALDHLLSCAVTLAEYQCRYRELAPSTMEKHFVVAKAHENMGHYLTAEYHCRRSIDRYCEIKAKIFPYTLSPNGSRHEESTTLLLRALTAFIIEFNANSLDRNAWIFQHMELLYIVLIRIQRERFDAGLSLCMHQLRATLALPDSDIDIPMIYPQIFIHGFNIAHECSLLGFIQPAAWMYDFLLRFCSEPLEIAHRAVEKAEARARHSILLRMQKREWRSSVNALLLACEVPGSASSDLSGAIRGLSIDRFLNAELPYTPEPLAIHELLAFDQLELIVSGEPTVEEAPSEKALTVVSSTWSTHESASSGIGVSWPKNCGEHLGIYDWKAYS